MVNSLLDNKVDTVSSVDLKEMLASSKVVLLDAREKAEFEVSHLAEARNVGFDGFDIESVSDLDKSDTIVVYCSIGKRSELIGEKLQQAGYTSVLNLYGGIFDWTNRGFQVYDKNEELVEQVHPYSTLWGFWVNNYTKQYEP